MFKEHTPSDRVQLRNQGELMHPGSCALFGSGNKEGGYIDFGIYYDYEGQFYLCLEDCFNEAAEVVGYLSPDKTEFLQNLLEKSAETNKALEKELEAANERLAKYDDLFSERLGVLAATAGSAAPVDGSEGTPAAGDSHDDSVNESSDGEPVTSESVTRRRKPHGVTLLERSDDNGESGLSL